VEEPCIEQFIEFLPDAVFVLEPDGTIFALNRRALSLVGEERSFLLGKLFYSVVEADGQKIIRQLLTTGSSDGSDGRRSNLRICNSSGKCSDVSLRVEMFRMKEKSGIIVVAREIGYRIELERQRMLQHDLATALVGKQDLMEAAGQVLATAVDISRCDGGALFLYHPESMVWELSHAVAIDRETLKELAFEEELNRLSGGVRQWIVFGDDGSGEPSLPPSEAMKLQGIKAAFAVPVFSDKDSVALIFLFSRKLFRLDHEKRRSLEIVASQFGSLIGRIYSERRFRSSESFSQSLIRSMPSGLLVRNQDGTIKLFNLAAEQLLGVSAAQVVGATSLPGEIAFFNEAGKELSLEEMPTFSILKDGKSIRNFLVRARKTDGKDVWLSINGEPLYRQGEHPEAAVITMKEMSEHLEMVKELELSRRAAETASKSKSRFLANISHEIRTPLSGIMGMTDILLSGHLTGDQRENILLMKEAEESLLDIINKVLEISKIESGKLVLEVDRFRLRGAINKSALPVFMGCKEKGIALDINIGSDVPDQLVGDGSRLTQVLTNFLSNALKFTARGSITLSVRKLFNLEESTVLLQFCVKDTGIGISEAQQGIIFEDFHQIDSSPAKKHQGTGLGLAISKKLVELMGGAIGVESSPGKGSMFFFSVPFGIPSPEDTAEPGKKSGHDFEGHLRVLLAEDNELNQRSICHFLQDVGHMVTVVPDGKQALELLEKEPFDLILMDVQMPEMDGMEATKLIRSHKGDLYNPEIPVIALTAYALKEDELRFIAAGMDRFVTKPVSRELLFQAIYEMTGTVTEHHGAPENLMFNGYSLAGRSEELFEFIRDYQNDLDIASQILDLFINEYPRKRKLLLESLQNRNTEAVAEILHSFTNNLSALRVFSLGNDCNLAEALAKAGDLEEVNRRIVQLFPRLDQVHNNAIHCLGIMDSFIG
jgi:PAS domain S-box-containing protein